MFNIESVRLGRGSAVTNVGGSGQHRGNWRRYWLRHTGQEWPEMCQVRDCHQAAQYGGHVYVRGLRRQFILPICPSCNANVDMDYRPRNSEWAVVRPGAIAVSVEAHENTFEYR